jgi:aromatic-L-amino-acid decarboxylase
MDAGRISLSREEMRALGYAAVDMLVEHFASLAAASPGRKSARPELEDVLREPPPEGPGDPVALLGVLRERVFSSMLHVDHPRFFAFVPSPGNFVGAVADALASGFNAFVGTWFAGSGAAEIELVTIDWLRQLCGLPEEAGGLFVSGGSVASLTALAVARHKRLGYEIGDAVAYYSDQTHSAVERAFRILGLAPAQMRRLPSDADYRLPLDALAREVAADRALRRRPFCVVANAGTTNTGAIDRLPELARFCREENLWLHVDGAYGAAAVVAPRGRGLLEGIQEADSLALDPHKWLFQPFECGCVLVRDRRLLRDTFRVTPEYLRDVHRFAEEVNFCDHGLQLTRGFRALKLWMSLKTFGLAAYRQAIEHGFHLAEAAETALRRSGAWEIVTPAQMAIVTFRHREDSVNQRLVAAMLLDGFATVTSTTLNGRIALRLCTINPRTTEADIEETIARLERLAGEM